MTGVATPEESAGAAVAPATPSAPAASLRPAAESPGDDRLAAVKAYWEEHVTDWPIARGRPGTPTFFRETAAYRFEKLDYLDRLVDYAGYRGREVLDVGCGLGNDAARFAENGARITGIDIAMSAVGLSQRNFSQRAIGGSFRPMNGEALEIGDNAYDLVYCHTVLHFTPSPERMVAEIHRVLRPGGTAILMMVNSRSWMRFLHRLMKVEIDHLGAPVFHWYSPEQFAALLEIFAEVDLRFERFPVRTKVHKGVKALIYNHLFVDLFNALPRRLTGRSGHHMVAIVRKQGA